MESVAMIATTTGESVSVPKIHSTANITATSTMASSREQIQTERMSASLRLKRKSISAAPVLASRANHQQCASRHCPVWLRENNRA